MLIYLATNAVTGKRYVGQTVKTLTRRWTQHVSEANRGSDIYFHRAIRKYGPESFTLVPIWVPDTQEEMDAMEIRFISALGTLTPEGYNGTTGGDHSTPTDTIRKKLSDSARSRPRNGMTAACLIVAGQCKRPAARGQNHWTQRETPAHKAMRITKAAESNTGKKRVGLALERVRTAAATARASKELI